MSGGGHSHGGGSSGAHGHGDGASGDPVGGLILCIIAFAIVGIVTEAVHLGQFAYEKAHEGRAPYAAGSWGSMYFDIGFALIFGVAALACFTIAAFRNNSAPFLITGVVLALLAVVLGLGFAPHFDAKAHGHAAAAVSAVNLFSID